MNVVAWKNTEKEGTLKRSQKALEEMDAENQAKQGLILAAIP